jgi:hypothetical protein
MPTQDEMDKYGAGLPIWEQLRLFSEWAPLIGYAQRFTNESDAYKRSVIVAEALEWVASKTSSPLDDELVAKVVAVSKTREGEDLIRWALAKAGAA